MSIADTIIAKHRKENESSNDSRFSIADSIISKYRNNIDATESMSIADRIINRYNNPQPAVTKTVEQPQVQQPQSSGWLSNIINFGKNQYENIKWGIQNPKAVGAEIKEFVAPSRGFTKEQIENAHPGVKEVISALSKYPANIAYSLLDTASSLMFGPQDKSGAEVFGADINPKTPGEAKAMQFADIATIFPMGTSKTLTKSSAVILEELVKNKASKSIIEKVSKYGDEYLKHLTQKESDEVLNIYKNIESPLIQEARKGEIWYHGTPAGFETKDFKGGYLTKDKNYADVYQGKSASSISYGSEGVKNKASGIPRTLEFVMKKDANLFDYTNPKHRALLKDYFGKSSMSSEPAIGRSGQLDWTEGENLAEFFREKGIKFDGIKLDEAGGIDPMSGLEVKRSPSVLITNPKVLKENVKFQPLQEVDPLIQETRKIEIGKPITSTAKNEGRIIPIKYKDGGLTIHELENGEIGISNVNVADKGKGTGTEMMNETLQYIKEKYPNKTVTLYPENLRNKQFYEKFGFKDMGGGKMGLSQSLQEARKVEQVSKYIATQRDGAVPLTSKKIYTTEFLDPERISNTQKSFNIAELPDKVKVYKGGGELFDGSYVSFDKEYAKQYGKLKEFTVNKSDLMVDKKGDLFYKSPLQEGVKINEELGKQGLEDIKKIFSEEKKSGSKITQKISSGIEKVRTAVTNRFTPVGRFENDVYKNIGEKAPKFGTKQILENFSSKKARAITTVKEFAKDVVKPIEKNYDEFTQYLGLRRIESRLSTDAEGKKVANWTLEKTTNSLNALKNQVGEETYKLFEKQGQKMQEYGDAVLKDLQESGILSKESVNIIKKNNDFYAPFKVMKYVDDASQGIKGAGRGLTVSTQDVIKAIKGIHDEEFRLGDILETMGEKIHNSIVLAEKNKIMQKFSKLADIDKEGNFIKKVANDTVPKKGYELVHYFEDGKKVSLEIPSDIAEALKGMDIDQAGTIIRGLRYAQAPFRLGVTTLNIGFQVVNKIFDTLRLATISKMRIHNPVDAIKFGIDFFTSFAHSMMGNAGYATKLYKEAEKAGVFSGTVYKAFLKDYGKFNPKQFTNYKTLSKLKKLNVLDIMGDIGSAIEESTKIMGYKRGKELVAKGKLSPEELLYEVRNYAGSPDFSRSGKLTPALNVLFMFFNARIQGLSADMRRLTGYAGGGKEAGKTWLSIATLLGMPVAINASRNNTKYKKDYEKLTDWEKQNYIIIFNDDYIKDKNGEYVIGDDGEKIRDAYRIPVRDTLGGVKNLIETMVDYGYTNDKTFAKAIKDFSVSTLENFSPINIQGKNTQERIESVISGTNPAIKAPIEYATGRDTFRHRETVPQYIEGIESKNLPPELQAKATTPEFFKQLGVMTNQSPLKLEQMFNTFGGAMVTQFSGGTDSRGNALTRRFLRSKYVQTDKSELDAVQKAVMQSNTKDYETNVKAKILYESIKDKPREERIQILKNMQASGELTEQMYTRYTKLRDKEKMGMSQVDYNLSLLEVKNGERAKMMLSLLKDKNKEERLAQLKKWQKQKILTATVYQQYLYLKNK